MTLGELIRRVRENYSNDPSAGRLTDAAMTDFVRDTLTSMSLKAGRAFYGLGRTAVADFNSGEFLDENGRLRSGDLGADASLPVAEGFESALLAAVRERVENINTAGASPGESSRQVSRDGLRGT